MEWIDGVPLQGPLPVEKAVAQAGFILDALDAAHRKGFTHRDHFRLGSNQELLAWPRQILRDGLERYHDS